MEFPLTGCDSDPTKGITTLDDIVEDAMPIMYLQRFYTCGILYI